MQMGQSLLCMSGKSTIMNESPGKLFAEVNAVNMNGY